MHTWKHQHLFKLKTVFLFQRLISKGLDTFCQYLFLCSEDISRELFTRFTHTEKYYVDVGWDENMRQR